MRVWKAKNSMNRLLCWPKHDCLFMAVGRWRLRLFLKGERLK